MKEERSMTEWCVWRDGCMKFLTEGQFHLFNSLVRLVRCRKICMGTRRITH